MNLADVEFLVPGASTPASFAERSSQVRWLNDFEGADPTGGDATGTAAALQAMINSAVGSPASPHGYAGKHTNKGCIIPPGNWKYNGPLVLPDVRGFSMIGFGSANTRLAYTGGTLNPSGAGPATTNGVTSLTMIYSTIEGLLIDLSESAASEKVCFRMHHKSGLDNNGTQNRFRDVTFKGAATGCLVGYTNDGLTGLGSENLLDACGFEDMTLAGFRSLSFNALNNLIKYAYAKNCETPVSCPAGAAAVYGLRDMDSGSLTSYCIANDGSTAMPVNGVRSNRRHFSHSTGPMHVSASAHLHASEGDMCVPLDTSIIFDGFESTNGKVNGAGANLRIMFRGCDLKPTAIPSNFNFAIKENI